MNWINQIRGKEWETYFYQQNHKKYYGKTPYYLGSLYATLLSGVCVQSWCGKEPFDSDTVIVQQDDDVRTTSFYTAKTDDIDEMIRQYKTPLEYQKLDRMDLFLDHLKNRKYSELLL